MAHEHQQWGNDCWGKLNEVADVSPAVATLSSLPEGFREARRAMLRKLNLQPSSRVLEAGCGPGTALPDLLELIGPGGEITGIDPTRALIAVAEQRAQELGAQQVSYEVGDIRELKFADGSFDATFCDKILLHVGPVEQAVAEMVRVTRSGGRVGAVEWYSQGMTINTSDYALTRRIMDGSFPVAAYNPNVALEIEYWLRGAGLREVGGGSLMAESLQFMPSLKAMLTRRVQQATEQGAIEPSAGDAWLRELEERDAAGHFYWCGLVRFAVGVKP
jgi:ubiquinone/menaquinone biosynthesis C-methylase UbiE